MQRIDRQRLPERALRVGVTVLLFEHRAKLERHVDVRGNCVDARVSTSSARVNWRASEKTPASATCACTSFGKAFTACSRISIAFVESPCWRRACASRFIKRRFFGCLARAAGRELHRLRVRPAARFACTRYASHATSSPPARFARSNEAIALSKSPSS